MSDPFADALRQLLAEQCTPQVVRAIEAGQSRATLWTAIEESGFADAMLDEAQGGAGLSLTDVFPLWELCGQQALPVPLAETMLARAVLARAGVAAPAGSVIFAPGRAAAGAGVVCDLVRSGRVADWVLVRLEHETLLLPTADATVVPAGFVLDAALAWPSVACSSAPRVPGAHDVQTWQACIHAAQLAGALLSVFQRTLDYANQRQQFGRPIGKFQAIQHQLSILAEHTFAARMAAQIGCCADTHVPQRLRVAVAKARASEAARDVAALSHAIHGAIGFTEAFDLQLYTRRLQAWRQAGGSESYWYGVLGQALMEQQDGHALELLREITDTDRR